MSMLNLVIVIFGSILFIFVGCLLVFRQDWLWEMTEKNAQKQGKKVKRTKGWNRLRKVVGWLGILWGVFGIAVMLIALTAYIPIM